MPSSCTKSASSIGAATQRAVETYDKSKEAAELAEVARSAVVGTGLAGAAGVVLLGVVSLTSFALHTQIAQPVLAESEADLLPAVEPEAMGEALFVAKGCIQCHVYDRVTMAENMIQIGPNLTYVKRSPEYLQAWLTNPPALKPETQMPNLQLSEAEIDELVAFLQQD